MEEEEHEGNEEPMPDDEDKEEGDPQEVFQRNFDLKSVRSLEDSRTEET